MRPDVRSTCHSNGTFFYALSHHIVISFISIRRIFLHFQPYIVVRATCKWNASELYDIEILRSMRVSARRRRWWRTLYGRIITLAITVCPKFYSSVHLKFKRRLILFVSLLSSAIGMAWCRTAYSQCTSEMLLNKTFFSFVPSFASCGKIYAQTTERNQSKYYLRINWEQKAICPWTAFIAGVRCVRGRHKCGMDGAQRAPHSTQ